MSNDKDDFVKPSVTLNGNYQSTYSHNQVATIFSAKAFDVLDPEVIGFVTVKDQVGNIITSVDQIKLDKVPYDRSYEIKLAKYGTYLVTYTARDTNGSGNAMYTYSLFVADNVKPNISVEKTNIEKSQSWRIF